MINLDRPEIQEECGVFGVFAQGGEDVAQVAFFGLFLLQHRGQESAGIAVSDGKTIRMHRDMGLVTQVFQEDILDSLTGHIAIGHTRYSTTGSSVFRNIQPLQCNSDFGALALVHNGDLINSADIREELSGRGAKFETTNDTEVIVKLIADSGARNIEDAITEAMKRISGAYAVVIMTEDKLIGIRDPHGIRPLCMGRMNGSDYVLASETCALHTIGAEFIREVEPGEMIVIDSDGLHERQAVPAQRHALCIFEFVYFARPDSRMYGRTMHEAR